MMSGHGAKPIFGRPEHSLTSLPHPPLTSNFYFIPPTLLKVNVICVSSLILTGFINKLPIDYVIYMVNIPSISKTFS